MQSTLVSNFPLFRAIFNFCVTKGKSVHLIFVIQLEVLAACVSYISYCLSVIIVLCFM